MKGEHYSELPQARSPDICWVILVAVATVTFHPPQVCGYPTGPPIDSYPELCFSMTPYGHSGWPSQSPSPYRVSFNQSDYAPGQPLEVTLEVGPSTPTETEVDSFRGFLVVVSNMNHTIGPKGAFYGVDAGTKAVNCSDFALDAWGHNDSSSKQMVTALWMPPGDDIGPLVARATVVFEFSVYWVDILSEVIKYRTPTEPAFHRRSLLQATSEPMTNSVINVTSTDVTSTGAEGSESSSITTNSVPPDSAPTEPLGATGSEYMPTTEANTVSSAAFISTQSPSTVETVYRSTVANTIPSTDFVLSESPNIEGSGYMTATTTNTVSSTDFISTPSSSTEG